MRDFRRESFRLPRFNMLSARTVASAKKPGVYADGLGLYMRVDYRDKSKQWIFIFQWHGKRKEMGLGSALAVSLGEARDRARGARAALEAGKNPIDERRADRASKDLHTFGAIADQLVQDLSPQWKSPIHRRQWTTTLTVDAAPLRALPASSITTDDVLGILRPIWEQKPETASRLRGRIERVLDAAKVKGLRTGENPARWKGHLELLLPKRQALTRRHHPAMPYPEVREFMRELRQRDGVSYMALEFTILTAARTGEVIQATQAEFDLQNRLWNRPAAHMKGKNPKPHTVTLCARAVAIVQKVWREKPDARVFPLSNNAMLEALDELGRGQYTVHGFRSTFKDWASDETDFQNEIIELALAHTIGNKVEQAYRRGAGLKKRFALMEAWEAYCEVCRSVPQGLLAA
jgi:integrase